MFFPDSPFEDAGAYFTAYAMRMAEAFKTVNREAMRKAGECLEDAMLRRATVFACGNGGSAAIANHLVCDCVKGVQTDTTLKPTVHSLSTNVEIITAIANDISYDQVFSYPLATFGREGDVLLTISSSGNSPNILNALERAKALGMRTIAMTGFDGGRAAMSAEIVLHVAAENYGIVEDVHQSMMHVLAQHLRQHNISDKSLLGKRKF